MFSTLFLHLFFSYRLNDRRRSSRVLVQSPCDYRADHVAPVGTAVPDPGVRRLPGVRQDKKREGCQVSTEFFSPRVRAVDEYARVLRFR